MIEAILVAKRYASNPSIDVNNLIRVQSYYWSITISVSLRQYSGILQIIFISRIDTIYIIYVDYMVYIVIYLNSWLMHCFFT